MHEENKANNPVALNLSSSLFDSSILQNLNTQLLSEQTIQMVIRSEQFALTGKVLSAKAHELNNSLQFIQCYLDLLLDFPLDDESRDEYLNLIRQEVQRLQGANATILSFASPPPPSNSTVSIETIVTYVLTLISSQLKKKRIVVSTDFKKGYLLIGSNEFIQVLLNVIINAIEAIDVDGTIHILSYENNDETIINITNSGSSIPDTILPNIFNPFFTTKPEGSGLGLWVCRKILQRNFGDINVKNLNNNCSVLFSINLPSGTIKEKGAA